MAPLSKKIGFIGAGMMAEALARGFIDKGVAEGTNMICWDPSEGRKDVFRSFGATGASDNTQLVKEADIIFIAVKPQYVTNVLKEVGKVLNSSKLIVSIAAGVPLSAIEGAAGPAPCVRVMPNTPCMVGETASAMCLGAKAEESHEQDVLTLMGAVGKCFTVPEKLLGAVTGVSGSGPAYVFMFIEAMADGGVRAGLPRDIAMQLAAQTVLGSAKMVMETGEHPGQLKDKVASPGGTTIAAIHALETGSLRNTVINAVYAAYQRSEEMSKM
ncbi:unnamed protein product [Pedinophyceae sp. YPF-701]|nr:unnamed protein product [Pedinophyceae sp. YPF-701]